MSSNELLAVALVAMSIFVGLLSKFTRIVEWFFRANADRKISNTDNQINKDKEDLNAIHNNNTINIDEYERAKRERR